VLPLTRPGGLEHTPGYAPHGRRLLHQAPTGSGAVELASGNRPPLQRGRHDAVRPRHPGTA
jgi:hypothetical protein